MIIDRFFDTVAKRGPVCVGLDTSLKLLPQSLATELPTTEAVLEFNRRIIDATLDLVACYKVQIAHYEALGVDGLSCYRDTLAYARGKNAIVIGDIKRGDIASTGEMYARAHLSGDFEADSVTVNPYMASTRSARTYLSQGGGEGNLRSDSNLQPFRKGLPRPVLP